jgi:hypothetical protein
MERKKIMKELNNIPQIKANLTLNEVFTHLFKFIKREEKNKQIDYIYEKQNGETIKLFYKSGKTSFIDYKSNKNGDIINFLQFYYDISFSECIKKAQELNNEIYQGLEF